jgi:hypothetical protein
MKEIIFKPSFGIQEFKCDCGTIWKTDEYEFKYRKASIVIILDIVQDFPGGFFLSSNCPACKKHPVSYVFIPDEVPSHD